MVEDDKKIDFSASVHEIHISEDSVGFDCYFFEIDQRPPKGIGKILEFYNIWHGAIQNNEMPSWESFSITDLKGWHSKMRLIKCGEKFDQKDEVRIVGETFAAVWGRKSLSENIRDGAVKSPEIIRKFHEYLTHLYDRKYAVCRGVLPDGGISARPIWFIDLPLAENGHDVTHVLSAIVHQ